MPVALQSEAVPGEGVEILHRRIHPQPWGPIGLPLQQLLHDGHVPVVDVGVGDDVDQLPGHQAGDLGQHVHQHAVLHHVPVVGRQHVLAALVEDGVEHVAADVEGHGPGAGVEGHLVQVPVVV